MITAEQIPDEVVQVAAKELAYTNGWRNEQGIAVCEPVARAIIAAALAAWPGASALQENDSASIREMACLILPLQEPRT